MTFARQYKTPIGPQIKNPVIRGSGRKYVVCDGCGGRYTGLTAHRKYCKNLISPTSIP